MGARLDIEIPADKLAAEYAKVLREAIALRQENARLTAAAGDLGDRLGVSFRQLSSIAQAAKASMAGPAAQYAAEAAKIEEALKRKMITEAEAAKALDNLAGRYTAAAGPADQYAIRVQNLQAKLAAGQISQQAYDAAVGNARQASLSAADGADRYQIELLELQRKLKDGEISQASYQSRLDATRKAMIDAAGPVDRVKIQLAALKQQLDEGKISASSYDQSVATLTAEIEQTPDAVDKLQQRLALLDAQLQRGTIDKTQHAQATARLRGDFSASASPVDQYRQKLAEADQQLRRGQITGEQYQQRIRDLRGEFGGSTTAADRYRAQIDLLRRAKDEGRISADQYRAAVERAGQEQEQLTEAAVPGIDSITSRLTGLLGGMLSVGGIVAQIKAVMEEAKQLREEQNRKQMTVSDAQAETVKMLGAVETPEAERFLKSVGEVGQQTGFKDTAALYLAAADTLSATAGNQEMTLAILKQAAPILKSKPQDVGTFAGAVADLATMQGATSDEQIKGVISQVLSITGQARITSLGAFKEAASGIAGAAAVDTGEDRGRAIQEAGAAFAAIGGAIKDPTGSLTKTAVSSLAVQLEKLLPEKDVLAPVSEDTRAKLLREKAGLQEKLAAFESGGEAERTADLEKAKADLEASNAKRQQLSAKARDERDPAKRAVQEAAADQEAARGQQLRVKLDQMRSSLPAGLEADAAEASLARQRLAAIETELTGVARKGTGMRTLADRISAVQQDEELQKLFLQGDSSQGITAASFEGPIKSVIRQLLTDRRSEAAQRFTTAQGAISSDTSTYDQLVANLQGASSQLSLAERARTAEAATEAFDLSQETGARRVTIEQQAAEALKRTRQGVLGFGDYIDERAMGGRMAAMGDEQAGEFAIAKLLMRRESIAGGGVRGRGLDKEQAAEINRWVGLEEQLRGPRLDQLLAVRGSDADQQRLQTLDAGAREQVQYLDAMIASLRELSRPVEVADRVRLNPAEVPLPAAPAGVEQTRPVDVADRVRLRPGQTPPPTRPAVATAPPAEAVAAARTSAAASAEPAAPAAAGGQLEKLTEIADSLHEIARTNRDMRDAETLRPEVGRSAAAAVPSAQRLGR